MSIEDLKKQQQTALAKYANCGCTKYKQEAAAIGAKIKELEKQKSNG
jgi:hypothetical protein